MVRDIYVTVRNKFAEAYGSSTIVAGNSDYTFHFDFDSEWEVYHTKTVRFAWKDKTTGKSQYRERIMSDGNSVKAPAIHNTNLLFVGVSAGNIRTTTPAVVVCYGSITDDAPYHGDPDADIYTQLIDLLENGGGGSHEYYPQKVTLLTSFPGIAPPESLPECIDTPVTVVGETDAMQYTWAQGDIDGSTGQDLNTQDFWWERRIREPDYIPIPPAAGIVRALPLVDGTNESAPKLYFYDSSKNFISCTGFQNYGDSLNIPANARFLRIVVGKYMVGSTIPLIVPADLSACEIEFRLGGS